MSVVAIQHSRHNINNTKSGGEGRSCSNNCKSYNTLLSIIHKALSSSREKIAIDAPHIIKASYGDLTSLFTSSGDDSDGVSRLVDLLLGKLDSVHDRFGCEKSTSITSSSSIVVGATAMTPLDELLQEQHILDVLRKIQDAVDEVEHSERQFHEADAADKNSAKEAIKLAKTSRMSPSGKKRRLMPAESIGYQAYVMKTEYLQSLVRELKEEKAECEKLENELKSAWMTWDTNVEGVKSALDAMNTLGLGDDSENSFQE